ncbi:MAG: class I SAM-dependent methyltransferase [Bacteroidia bacterium]
MSNSEKYLVANKNLWNNKVAHHVASDFYKMEEFLKGTSSLNSIELDLLGNIEGKSVLHLQCHFGQDSISLARLGAKVTGVDFSENAIEKANIIAKQTNTNIEFICCDVYNLPNHLNKKFDIVFTSYGTIGWLPDMDKWAGIIAHFLKPNGQLVFAEFHPVVWMYDNDFKFVQYNYFKDEPIVEFENGTYADRNAAIQGESITWNHSLSEVVNALILNGLKIIGLNEFDYSPYSCFANVVEFEKGKFRIAGFENKLPMVYSILAQKMA